MYIVALTGGIGSGKSTAAHHFASKGAVVIDLDEAARRLVVPGTEVFDRVLTEFGEGVLDADGNVDRKKLADAAFASPADSERLNRIVHPALARDILPGLTEMGLLLNPPPLVVMEVPMLVEAQVFAEVSDIVLAISAPLDMRVARCVARDMSEADARRRAACQSSEEDRILLADQVIVNVGTETEFLAELDRFWDEVVVDEP